MKLSEQIKQARIKAGMTQKQLSECLNVSQQQVAKSEKGKLSLQLLQAISDVLKTNFTIYPKKS